MAQAHAYMLKLPTCSCAIAQLPAAAPSCKLVCVAHADTGRISPPLFVMQLNGCGPKNSRIICSLLHRIVYQPSNRMGFEPGDNVDARALFDGALATWTPAFEQWMLEELTSNKFYVQVPELTCKVIRLLRQRMFRQAKLRAGESVAHFARRMQKQWAARKEQRPTDKAVCIRVVAQGLPREYGTAAERDALVLGCSWAAGLARLQAAEERLAEDSESDSDPGSDSDFDDETGGNNHDEKHAPATPAQ